jgi:hypothetical protein
MPDGGDGAECRPRSTESIETASLVPGTVARFRVILGPRLGYAAELGLTSRRPHMGTGRGTGGDGTIGGDGAGRARC